MRRLTCPVLAMALFVSGCASQGERKLIPLTMPDGERATIVTHQNYVPKWARLGSAISYVVSGESPTSKQLEAVSRVEEACAELTRITHPHNLVTLTWDATIFAASGFLGGYLGSLAFPGAIASQYGTYGAAAGGAFGIPYGAITLSGKDYTFQNCGREMLHRFPAYKVQPIIESVYP